MICHNLREYCCVWRIFPEMISSAGNFCAQANPGLKARSHRATILPSSLHLWPAPLIFLMVTVMGRMGRIPIFARRRNVFKGVVRCEHTFRDYVVFFANNCMEMRKNWDEDASPVLSRILQDYVILYQDILMPVIKDSSRLVTYGFVQWISNPEK